MGEKGAYTANLCAQPNTLTHDEWPGFTFFWRVKEY